MRKPRVAGLFCKTRRHLRPIFKSEDVFACRNTADASPFCFGKRSHHLLKCCSGSQCSSRSSGTLGNSPVGPALHAQRGASSVSLDPSRSRRPSLLATGIVDLRFPRAPPTAHRKLILFSNLRVSRMVIDREKDRVFKAFQGKGLYHPLGVPQCFRVGRGRIQDPSGE